MRRSKLSEKYLVIVKQRIGHFCNYAIIVVSIVAWEGVSQPMADNAYDVLRDNLGNHGRETKRRCGANAQKACLCQGKNDDGGASYSFGCSWSYYLGTCKFAVSSKGKVAKYRLDKGSEDREEEVEETVEDLATTLGPLYKKMVPDAYKNQVAFESIADSCRIGNEPGKPFSGVTSVLDFCAHAHRYVQ